MNAANALLGSDKAKMDIFYRKIFYQCCDFIEKSNKNVLVLIGPRKCGKTFCFKQLQSKYGLRYVNFKKIEDIDTADEVFTDIINRSPNECILLDEITYIDGYMERLAAFDEMCVEKEAAGEMVKTKLIITGSCSYAIGNAVSLALATKAEYLYTSFIDFEEWVVYRNGFGAIPTVNDFKDYFVNSNVFAGIEDNLEYISSCLSETIISESNSYHGVKGIVCDSDLRAEDILSVLYASLLSLHEQHSFKSMQNESHSIVGVRTTSPMLMREIKQSELEKRIDKYLSEFVTVNLPKDVDTIRVIIAFLQQLDLITITEVGADLDSEDVYKFIYKDSRKFRNPTELFKACNICVKHPMFYFNMVKEVLYDVEDLRDKIGNKTYGSAYECIMKGLLSYKYGRDFQYEYRDELGHEVDMVVSRTKEAYEFTVSPKHNMDGLRILPDDYKVVITTSQESYNAGSCAFRNYIEYMHELSRGNFIKRVSPIRWFH